MKPKDVRKNTIFGFVFGFVLIFVMPLSFAQEIPITISSNMDKVEFDGKWTFPQEWKASSTDRIPPNSNPIYIRSAHHDNYIYILLDVIPDKTFDKNEDQAMVCFDAKSEQSAKPDSNDYCFKATLGSGNAITLQGSEESGKFEVVENPPGLIAVGGISDEYDRHSKIPHTSYEFRIPIDLLQRTDHYGFFIKVFDFTNSETYTWPSEIDLESNSDIASPAKWGLIYSPDKSLPEYDLPILVLLLGTFSIILFSWKNKKLNLSYINR